jgi:heparanase 1
VNKNFVSVALSSGFLNYSKIPVMEVLTSQKFVNLASALAPTYLRIGGTKADFVIFDPNVTESRPRLVGTERDKRKSLLQGALEDYWQTCGVCEEEPQLEIFKRDLGQFAKREQLSLQNVSSDDMILFQVFDAFKKSKTHHKRNYKNFTLTAADWDVVNTFVKKSGLRLIWDLNVLLRTPYGQWDTSNAEELLAYNQPNQDHDFYDMDFQLGNEPNSFHHSVNRTISPQQLSFDFWKLKNLLRAQPHQNSTSLLIGPDITQPKKSSLEYLHAYLKVAITAIDAISWHHYYVNGRTATLKQFMDPKILDSLKVDSRIRWMIPMPKNINYESS